MLVSHRFEPVVKMQQLPSISCTCVREVWGNRERYCDGEKFALQNFDRTDSTTEMGFTAEIRSCLCRATGEFRLID